MRLRPGRSLAAAAVAAASVTALGVATASAAPSSARSVAASAHVKNPLGSVDLLAEAALARTASTAWPRRTAATRCTSAP